MRIPPRYLALGAVAALILYLARHTLAPFVVALILAYVFTPVIDGLVARARLSRAAAVALLYLFAIVAVTAIVMTFERQLVHETRGLLREGPRVLEQALTEAFGGREFVILGQPVTVTDLSAAVQAFAVGSFSQGNQAIRIAESLLDFVLKTFLCLVATFYLLLDGRRVGSYLIRFVPADKREAVTQAFFDINHVLSRFVRGQLVLIALMSVVTYVGLAFVFHLHFALPIALATGVLEVIPLFGPAIAAAIAATVGFTQGGVQMLVALVIFYTVLRQVEDQLVMPQVVGRAVHLHPLMTIFAVVVGEAIAGVLGMLLAVPVTAALKVVIDRVFVVPEPPPTERLDPEPGPPAPSQEGNRTREGSGPREEAWAESSGPNRASADSAAGWATDSAGAPAEPGALTSF